MNDDRRQKAFANPLAQRKRGDVGSIRVRSLLRESYSSERIPRLAPPSEGGERFTREDQTDGHVSDLGSYALSGVERVVRTRQATRGDQLGVRMPSGGGVAAGP